MSVLRPIVLAIETSQRVGGVAVADRTGTIHVEMLNPEGRHDDDLLPAIDRLFKRLGLSPGDLADGAVGVSIGPGGFTGLRIAVSTAKMFAEALVARLVAVPSALVAAQAHGGKGPLLVALASKRGSFWATRVVRGPSGWSIASAPAPGLADAATMTLEGIAAVLADEHLPPEVRARCEQAGVPIIQFRFDPAACVEVASRMLDAGEVTDALSLLPLYARQPEAVTLWEQRREGTVR